VTVTKDVDPGKLVYGELTPNAPLVDELYQFFVISPISPAQSSLRLELYWKTTSILKKTLFALVLGRVFKKNSLTGINALEHFINESNSKKASTQF